MYGATAGTELSDREQAMALEQSRSERQHQQQLADAAAAAAADAAAADAAAATAAQWDKPQTFSEELALRETAESKASREVFAKDVAAVRGRLLAAAE